jgi:protein-S-isoprenylcysteine O-methyltransferase Ste14
MKFGLIVPCCWIVFLLYWVASASSVKAAAKRQSWIKSLTHRVPVGLSYWLLLVPDLPGPLPVAVIPDAALVRPLGVAICVCGLLGAIWSRRTLAGNWSSDVQFKQEHELVSRGPYRFVRHPIYTSLLLMGLGTAIAANRLGALAGLLSLFAGVWIKLRQEEKLLLQHFPDDYPAYKARVKALVPFIF